MISGIETEGVPQTKKKAFDLLNEINQKFVDIVRNSGGNNAKRHLLIAGYATDFKLTCDSFLKCLRILRAGVRFQYIIILRPYSLFLKRMQAGELCVKHGEQKRISRNWTIIWI